MSESEEGANAPESTQANANESTQNEAPQESSSERLLRESKEYKLRAQRAEAELKKIQAKTLQDQGQYKELFEAEKAAKEKLKQQVMVSRVRETVSAVAAKAGCVSPDAAFKLLDGSLIQFDEDSLEVVGADIAIEKLKQEVPVLFSKVNKSTVNPTTPSGAVGETKKLTALEIARLPKAERQSILAQALGRK